MGGILLLEDGRTFKGAAFGARGSRVGEIVFNTAMTGYQEVITDPSYCEQIVVMTTPHIGNTGINKEDPESSATWVSGFIAREFARQASNHRATENLSLYLRTNNVPALQGIDTRALVRHIREKGAMKAVISTDGTPREQLQAMLSEWPGMAGRALATEVCAKNASIYHDPPAPRARVTVVDGGVKTNILRLLAGANCRVRVVPIHATAEEWMAESDFLFLSNGPGDPAALSSVVDELKKVLGTMPMVGICLGHQLLALTLGAKTYKLRFGHRGANHPVRDIQTGKIEITSQNHGFCVDEDSLTSVGGQITHLNLNDQTIAGMKHDELRVMGVQFHPESCPGPHDSQHLLIERFLTFAGVEA